MILYNYNNFLLEANEKDNKVQMVLSNRLRELSANSLNKVPVGNKIARLGCDSHANHRTTTKPLHPFIYAYLTKGFPSRQLKWYFKYKKWIHLEPVTFRIQNELFR